MSLQFQPQDSKEPTPANGAAELLAEFRAALERRLSHFLDEVGNEVATIAPAASPVVAELQALTLRGGKRLRAGFVLAGVEAIAPWQTFGAAVLDVCVALELFQSYLLIHDDWMDGDSVRRAGPTVHVALAEIFGNEHQGAAGAVLAGDLACSLAQSLLCGPSLRAAQVQRLMSSFASTQRQVMLGQTLDLLGAADVTTTNELKTSSYTVRGPLALAMALTDGTPELTKTLDAYAKPLGLAFQLRDDLLGAFGECEQTGKGPFTDIEKGKQTAVFACALSGSSATDRASLLRLLGAVGAAARAEAHELLTRARVRELLEAEISAHCRQAVSALDASPLRNEGRHLLERLAQLATSRSS